MRSALRIAKRLAAATVATLTIVGGLAAANADATTFQVWTCTDRTSDTAKASTGLWSSVNGAAFNFCPEGLEFPSGANLGEQGGEYTWIWNQSAGDSVLKRITLTMKGGNTTGGLVYELAENQSAEAFHTLPARAAGAADLTVAVNIPAGISTIAIRARCTTPTCSGTSRLRVNEIKFLLEDTTAPVAWMVSDPNLNFTSDGGTTGDVPWFRSDSLPVGISVTDGGGGVAEASLALEGYGILWNAQPTCTSYWEFFSEAPPAIVYDSPTVCAGGNGASPLLNLRGVAEGRHKLTLTAKDAFGLASEPLSGWFGVDDTRPAAPKNFQFINTSVNEHGWTQSALFAAYADAPPNEGPNASPIDGGISGMVTRDDDHAGDQPPRTFIPYGILSAFPSEGHFRVESWFTDKVGNPGFSAYLPIGFDRTRPPEPELHPNDWISRDQLVEGYEQSWKHLVAPEDVESDICGFNVAFDKEAINSLPGVEKIKGNVDSAPVPANLAEGRNFSHVAAVSCSGVVSGTADTLLPVDATAPQVEIDGLPLADWSRDPLELTLRAADELSGVESMDWSLDDEPAKTTTGEAEVSLGDGEHVLTTSAIDKAGNASSSDSRVIRVDSSGPASWLGPTGTKPNEFSAHVKDAVSGLDSAALQFRRVDAAATPVERVWRQAGAAYLPAGSALGDHSFKRSLDDSALADGTYELRVAAVDRAGNVEYGSTLPESGNVQVTLPLRARPAIALAVSDLVRRCSSTMKRGCRTDTKCRRGSRCTFKWVSTPKGAGLDRIVDWGDRTALTGTVLTPGGAPLPGVKLSIYSTPEGGSTELIGSTTSGSDGSFEKQIDDGPSRSFVVKSGATDDLAAAEMTATLAVRAGVTFSVSDDTPRPGQRVRLSGQLKSGGMGVPFGGKKITIEFYKEGEWRPLRGTFTDGAGRFRRNWSIPVGSTAGTVFLRAHAESLPTETAWPFEGGKSEAIRIDIHR